MTYDRWAEQKARIRSDFDEYMTDAYGKEQTGISPRDIAMLLDAWNWSAIRVLEMAATVAERTFEGSTGSTDAGDSGYDYVGDNTAQSLRELADGLAKKASARVAIADEFIDALAELANNEEPQ